MTLVQLLIVSTLVHPVSLLTRDTPPMAYVSQDSMCTSIDKES
jgi:hypothetical protein